MWAEDPGFIEVIQKSWHGINSWAANSIVAQILDCRKVISGWKNIMSPIRGVESKS